MLDSIKDWIEEKFSRREPLTYDVEGRLKRYRNHIGVITMNKVMKDMSYEFQEIEGKESINLLFENECIIEYSTGWYNNYIVRPYQYRMSIYECIDITNAIIDVLDDKFGTEVATIEYNKKKDMLEQQRKEEEERKSKSERRINVLKNYFNK